jgi:hypothetical protein
MQFILNIVKYILLFVLIFIIDHLLLKIKVDQNAKNYFLALIYFFIFKEYYLLTVVVTIS